MCAQDMPEIDVRTLGARLRQYREEKGLSQRELARRAGIGQKTLQRIESGDMLLMSPHLPKLAAKLNVLLNDPFASNVLEPSHIKGKPVPVWDRVQAGKWAKVPTHLLEKAATTAWIVPQEVHGPGTFALIVHGDSMLPLFREGDIAVVDPDVPPASGRYVVARDAEGIAVLKIYAARGKDDRGRDKFELRPLNDLYETLSSDKDPVTILGVVVEKTTRFV